LTEWDAAGPMDILACWIDAVSYAAGETIAAQAIEITR
jgi:hypothetical protein